MDWKTAFGLSALKSYALAAVSGLVGWRAWLAKLAIQAIFRLATKLAKYLEIRKEVKDEIKKKLKKYDEVLNDPNATADDIKRAGDDFLK